MTVSDIYEKLYSRAYYDKTENNKFRFLNNSLFIDRRSIVPIVIHMLDGIFYIQAFKQIANESLFRLEINEDDIKIYSALDDHPLWTLE
ncbi:hypothetical protein SIO70_23290 [Chitinophaga sancti]|uniref:hypothetical protein n=1 Tax=Chitinophaga sancti TaxID=1004 RepID=UPI002A75CEAD|nr:hypothetical protein [Chitinophaga sancti]WPQ61286.1 hypothetical protein SIO70_23290 [Chitinophaga sancti]